MIALLRYCACQCVAALPVLVDFPLLAAMEDYCDSPSLLIVSLPQSLSVCLSHSLHPLGSLVSALIKATQALCTRVEYFCWSEQALNFTLHSFNILLYYGSVWVPLTTVFVISLSLLHNDHPLKKNETALFMNGSYYCSDTDTFSSSIRACSDLTILYFPPVALVFTLALPSVSHALVLLLKMKI